MAQLVVRNLEDEVKAKLRRRAAAHGCSMEEEVRAILRSAVNAETERQHGLGTRIATLFAGIGLRDGEDIRSCGALRRSLQHSTNGSLPQEGRELMRADQAGSRAGRIISLMPALGGLDIAGAFHPSPSQIGA